MPVDKSFIKIVNIMANEKWEKKIYFTAREEGGEEKTYYMLHLPNTLDWIEITSVYLNELSELPIDKIKNLIEKGEDSLLNEKAEKDYEND